MTSTTADTATVPVATTRRGGRVRWTVVLLTSLTIVAYAVGTYARAGLPIAASKGGPAATYAERPVAVQVTFYVHIVTASLALLVGPFQFSTALRRRSPAVHRWTGRVCLLAVAASPPTASPPPRTGPSRCGWGCRAGGGRWW